ncbi:MAG: UDP-3-O-[3-hydroxymyristoyl] N-acetylglucosamine deacetylase [Omnitrophica bacterium RIFCSPLOWO2_01_FULL_45_24]|nr:MAG: UDP-3-O-[3-hydroxymyristoyl] N-acetylglucosamine deacetylase [Omnitrophica bacterium RIFCSPLOWO2_01_FULL_45_24]
MIKQKTIKDPVVIEGIGLQTGSKTKLNFKGAPANSGINFIRVDLPNKPLLNIQSLSFDKSMGNSRRTTLSVGPVQVQTIEHLLAALSGLGINNIIVETDGVELPGLDGSAKEYVTTLEKAGIVEQDAPLRTITVEKEIWCSDKDSFLAIFPYNGLRVSYFLSYPTPSIGEQFLSLEISEEVFKRDIAPARTFCVVGEALVLLALGFGKGSCSKNTLIMGKRGPVGNNLRFPDEPVRHKILDLLGDLYLVGMPLIGHIIAVKSGHKLNMEMVKKLKEKI